MWVTSVMKWTRADRLMVLGITQSIQAAGINSAGFDAASMHTFFDVSTFSVRFTLQRYDRFTVAIVGGNTVSRANTHNCAHWICVEHCAFLICRANSWLSAWVFTFLIDASQFRGTLRVFATFWSNRSSRF